MNRWKRLTSKRFVTTTLVLFASSIGGTAGCEIISQVDRSQIDGAGGSACVPENDMNDCTDDACNTDGTTAHTPKAEGTACSSNGGSKCDANGACVQCFTAEECPGDDTACQTRTCTMGACGFDYTAADTPIPTQVAGDCLITVCDGNGATIDNNDDMDVPDDMNACTDDVCTMGTPSNTNLPQGTDCTPAGGPDPLVCNDMAQCVGCNTADDCPGTDDECKTRTCTANVCGFTFTAADTPVAAQTDNDCLQHVCDGNGNFVDIADDTDLPLDDGNACTDEVCNGGMPSHPNMADGTMCEEGDLCTTMDTCQMGTCTAGTPITCTALDACHEAGTCDPMTGMCSNPNAPDGTTCDDSDACTQTDSCTAGTCTGANPVVCMASDQCHVAGTCDPMTGMCSDPDAPDGTSCDDSDACTQTDSCMAGTCSGANPITCMPLDQCHVAGMCDPMTGTCSDPDAPDGTACTSNMASGMCTMGACIACGDGIVDATEACDDGNTAPSDGCSTTCTLETGWNCSGAPSTCTAICGDGLLRGGEVCDDGNMTAGDGCSDTCALDITCGAGEVPVILTNTTSSAIPDNAQGGIISVINVAQTGVVRKVIPSFNIAITNTGHIDSFLTSPHGVQRELATDVGTSANFTGTIFSDAAATAITAGTAPYTGTFRPEQTISDAAGFGNQTAAGNWVLRLADDLSGTTGTLNAWSLALCIDPSVPSVCGNGFVEPGEQCDDMNANAGDGCASCQLEITCAGNETLVVMTSTDGAAAIPDNNLAGISSVINVSDMGVVGNAVVVANAISHQFDGDLNLTLISATGTTLDLSSRNGSTGDNYVSTIFSDAASTNVTTGTAPFRGRFKPEVALSGLIGQVTNGAWTFNVADAANIDGGLLGSWSLGLCVAPTPTCGDGMQEIGETCDDNNTNDGDGCSSTCAVEPGWLCMGNAPSICSLACGNGMPDAGEQCDDMNMMSGDGCSSTCTVEPDYTCTPAPSTCTPYETNCSDMIDNDGDGNADAADSDCTLPAYFPPCQSGETLRVYRSFHAPIAIPDANTTGITSPLFIVDNIGNIASGGMVLNITHPFDGDVDVSIVSPANVTFDLTSDNGSTGDNYTETVLHPVCPTLITAGTSPFSGCFAPEASLLPLLGTPAQGAWTLKVVDDGGGDLGTLDNWKLAFCIAP